MEFILHIANHDIRCVENTQDPVDFTVTVTDPTNTVEVQEAVKHRIAALHWPLAQEYAGEQLSEQFDFTLATGQTITVFSFLGRPLSSHTLTEMADTLGAMAGHLKNPRDMLPLRSIQIRLRNQQNPKSGDFTYGREHIDDGRFELFPAAFASGIYRGLLHCSWLTGVMLHETTHVCLEKTLKQTWDDYAMDLGWRYDDSVNIILPGGQMTHHVNIEPERCVTPYATYQRDDDRAESVVAFLLDVPFDQLRTQLLRTVLKPEDSTIACTVTPSDPQLPVPKAVTFRISTFKGIFDAVGPSISGTPRRRMTLEHYLARTRKR